MKRYVLPLISILGLGCGHEPLEQAEGEEVLVETDGFAVTKPPSKLPGSTGGICGVNFDLCDDGRQTYEKFRLLPKTNISVSRELKNMNASNNSRKVTLKFRVPRMVNDHKEKLDQLEVINEATRFDADGGNTKISYKRNGTIVGTFAYDRYGNNLVQSVDVYRGGWETIMAFASDTNKNTMLMQKFARETSITQSAPQSLNSSVLCVGKGTKGSAEQRCFWCKATQIGVSAGPGVASAIVTGLLRLRAVVATSINVAAGIAGPVAGAFIDCDKVCNRQDCFERYCAGGINNDEYDTCCRTNGGYVSERIPGNVTHLGECRSLEDLI